jgi:hypothetical protein
MTTVQIEVEGRRQTITIHAVPRGGDRWEGRALGVDPFAPEATCDPGMTPSDVLVRVHADSRDGAVAAVLAALQARYRVV